MANVNDRTSPCKHCADRALGCHGVCKDYFEYQQVQRERNKWLKQQQARSTINKYSFTGTTPPPGKHMDRKWRKSR